MIISKYKNFNLEKLYPRLYLLRFNNFYDMCMTFLRYQEKYESPNPKFRNKDFTILDFMEWYSKSKNNFFSYTVDWSGFNLPDTVFKENWFYNIPDKNKYDAVMLDVYYTIWHDIKYGVDNFLNIEMPADFDKGRRTPKYYLIGSVKNHDAIDHEVAHGFYYLNSSYKKEMDLLTKALPKKFTQDTYAWLKKMGYTPKVYKDEMQAYMSTGFPEKDIKLPKDFKKLKSEYKKVYKKYIA